MAVSECLPALSTVFISFLVDERVSLEERVRASSICGLGSLMGSTCNIFNAIIFAHFVAIYFFVKMGGFTNGTPVGLLLSGERIQTNWTAASSKLRDWISNVHALKLRRWWRKRKLEGYSWLIHLAPPRWVIVKDISNCLDFCTSRYPPSTGFLIKIFSNLHKLMLGHIFIFAKRRSWGYFTSAVSTSETRFPAKKAYLCVL